MTINNEILVRRISETIIFSWNKKIIQRLIEYLSENAILKSPNVQLFFPEKIDNTIVGKSDIKAFWTLLQQSNKYYQVKLERFEKNHKKVHLYLSIVNSNKFLDLVFTYDNYGKLTELVFDFK